MSSAIGALLPQVLAAQQTTLWGRVINPISGASVSGAIIELRRAETIVATFATSSSRSGRKARRSVSARGTFAAGQVLANVRETSTVIRVIPLEN